MPDEAGSASQSYGQTFRSVRRSTAPEERTAWPESASYPYGQTFRSVRDGPDEGRGPPWPADTSLLPRGLKRPRRSSPRLQDFDYTGPYAYSITINTDRGRPHFTDDRFIRFAIRILEKEAVARGFEIIAYCFMPNHVHLLAQGLTQISSLKPFMQQFKQITGFAFKQEHDAPLWHRSYYDRVLRKDEDIPTVAAYIWGNPVRAGLVESAEDYPYSGPTARLAGEAERPGDGAALGGQSLSSVRTNPPSPG